MFSLQRLQVITKSCRRAGGPWNEEAMTTVYSEQKANMSDDGRDKKPDAITECIALQVVDYKCFVGER
jgi:hypothetical protein